MQDFWCEKLLEGGLNTAFAQTQTVGAFSRYLEKMLRNWLIDLARSTGTPRLRSRLRETLRDGPFVVFAEMSQTGAENWGLESDSSSELGPYEGSELGLLQKLHSLGATETPRGRGDGKADTVVSNKELLRLVTGLFELTGTLLTVDELAQVFAQRFISYYPPVLVAADGEAAELEDEDPDVVTTVASLETARRVLAKLTGRQAEMLRGRLLENRTLDQLAAEHDCSRGTADNEVQRATAILSEHIDPNDLTTVWKSILDLTSGDVDGLPSGDRP